MSQSFVKNFRCKICDFLGEIIFTKYGENESDSLEVVTRISLSFVSFWVNHQIW